MTKKTSNTTAKAEPKPVTGKTGALIALMRRETGATLAELTEATGWQAHGVPSQARSRSAWAWR